MMATSSTSQSTVSRWIPMSSNGLARHVGNLVKVAGTSRTFATHHTCRGRGTRQRSALRRSRRRQPARHGRRWWRASRQGFLQRVGVGEVGGEGPRAAQWRRSRSARRRTGGGKRSPSGGLWPSSPSCLAGEDRGQRGAELSGRAGYGAHRPVRGAPVGPHEHGAQLRTRSQRNRGSRRSLWAWPIV